MTPAPPSARAGAGAGWLPVAFLAGGLLAVVTSGGIVEERLSAGSVDVGIVVNAFVTFASILTLGIVQARASSSVGVLISQVTGAVIGVVAVHVALRAGWIPRAPWLVERPAQLVNDTVAVGVTLTVVWACARGLRLPLLIGALVVLTAYRVTAPHWHLDAPPQGFKVTVQDFVVAQFVAAALALAVFRGMTRHAT